MRIILNSDVLHMNRLLATGLAKHIDEFCREAAQAGAVLVLIRTVVLENERHQMALRDEAIAEVTRASSALQKWGVAVPPFDAEQLIPKVNLIDSLQSTGIPVEVQDPTLDDYRDAERRASLHLSPQAVDAKSDEMRDLVIWVAALRVALQHRGGMLVSRDEVHSHERGSEEAGASQLLRAKSFDDALDQLGRVSPAGILARSVLASIWNELRANSVPLPEAVPARRFSDLQFSADDEGYAATRLSFEIATDQGKFCGKAHIRRTAPLKVSVELTELSLAGRQWNTGLMSLALAGELPKITSPVAERMADLLDAIGGEQ